MKKIIVSALPLIHTPARQLVVQAYCNHMLPDLVVNDLVLSTLELDTDGFIEQAMALHRVALATCYNPTDEEPEPLPTAVQEQVCNYFTLLVLRCTDDEIVAGFKNNGGWPTPITHILTDDHLINIETGEVED